ncbi:MAG: hypothetical protein HRT56_07005 [Coraliomargarita sp.]|nr:hypothetical protein [Coraliomargarita sp.]
MNRLLPVLLCSLIPFFAFAHDTIKFPNTLRVQVDESSKRQTASGNFSDQWVATFNELRFNTSNRADIILKADEEDYVIENVFKLEVSEMSNLLILTYRKGRKDYRAIISPDQIRMIREADPTQSGI